MPEYIIWENNRLYFKSQFLIFLRPTKHCCRCTVGFPRDVPGQTGTGRPVVPLSRDKKIFLSRCPFVPGQGQEQMSRDKLFCPGTSRDKITPKKPGKRRSETEKGRSKTGKWRSETGKGCSKTGKGCSITGKWCPKTGNLVFFWNCLIYFVPGQRNNGTSRPGLSRDVPSRGNPNLD